MVYGGNKLQAYIYLLYVDIDCVFIAFLDI